MLTACFLEKDPTDSEDSERAIPLVEFDCKAWNLPNQNKVIASILYHQIDCIRNSMQQTAQTYLSHKELLNKDIREQVSMLKERTGIDWDTFSEDKKYGRYLHRMTRPMTKTFVKKDGTSETISFEKLCWEVSPMPQLTEEESRKILMENLGR